MRFISEDTNKGDVNDPLSLNLYTYCEENPIKYSDPTGYGPQVTTEPLPQPSWGDWAWERITGKTKESWGE